MPPTGEVKLGHSRDERNSKLQIVIGLLTNRDGCPMAVEVFEGNTGDPKTVAGQIAKIRERFGIQRVVLVGDGGVLTSARIREDLKPTEGIDWITGAARPHRHAQPSRSQLAGHRRQYAPVPPADRD